MRFTNPPSTPRTPLSPSFGDRMQSMIQQEFSTIATETEQRPRTAPTTQLSTATTLENLRDLSFDRHCKHLLRPLAPLLSIETGKPHPQFPKTILQYHLLSRAELEELAHFYHQRTPSKHSTEYPMPVIARWHALPDENDMEVDSETQAIGRALGVKEEDIPLSKSRRRRFGRFLGLQGMDSAVPSAEGVMREEMERYVAREMAKREHKAREREVWEAKGFY